MQMFIENERATWLPHPRDELRALVFPLYLSIKNLEKPGLREMYSGRSDAIGKHPTISDPQMRDPISSLTGFTIIGFMEKVLAEIRQGSEKLDGPAAKGEDLEQIETLRRWLAGEEEVAIATAKGDFRRCGFEQERAEKVVDDWLYYSRQQTSRDPMYIVNNLRVMWTGYLNMCVRDSPDGLTPP
jgi:hypothetical protein